MKASILLIVLAQITSFVLAQVPANFCQTQGVGFSCFNDPGGDVLVLCSADATVSVQYVCATGTCIDAAGLVPARCEGQTLLCESENSRGSFCTDGNGMQGDGDGFETLSICRLTGEQVDVTCNNGCRQTAVDIAVCELPDVCSTVTDFTNVTFCDTGVISSYQVPNEVANNPATFDDRAEDVFADLMMNTNPETCGFLAQEAACTAAFPDACALYIRCLDRCNLYNRCSMSDFANLTSFESEMCLNFCLRGDASALSAFSVLSLIALFLMF